MIKYVILFVVLMFAATLQAQPNPQAPNGFGIPLDPVSRVLDVDGDRILSEEEIENAAKTLMKLDSDGDGTLSLQELLPGFPGRGMRPGIGGGGPMGPNRPEQQLADKFDRDNNGFLDQEERTEALSEVQVFGGGRRGPQFGPDDGGGVPGRQVDKSSVEHFPKAKLYDVGVLRTVFIEFKTEGWESELASFKNTDVEVPATVTVDGKRMSLVGVKFRGQSSFFSVPEGRKRSLNLSLDLVNKEQRLYGYKTLNFLNCNGDPTFMSSVLYSQLANSLMPVPKANFVHVVINGTSWGIYCNVQQFNKDFIKDHYGTSQGARWKVSGSPMADGGLRYLGDNIDDYRQRFEIKSKDSEESWKSLIHLCKALDETPVERIPEAIEPILNVDGVLRFLAMDMASVNSDGYWTRASDYSLYLDPKGVFHVIPHDMNEAFTVTSGARGMRGGRGGGPQRGGLFGPAGPAGAAVPADRVPIPGPEGPGDDADNNRRVLVVPDTGRPGGGPPGHGSVDLDPFSAMEGDRMPLRSKLLAVPAYREKYARYLKTIASETFDLANVALLIEDCRRLIRSEVEADTRKLTTFERFQSSTDFPLEDGLIPGNLYSFFEDRQRYLLEHEAIAVVEKITLEQPTMPQRIVLKEATEQYSNLVISELLASNSRSGNDPQGEPEDWIELSNNGDEPIDLSGMYLSDDLTQPHKWRIPDSTILKSGEFLVIWADEDEQAPGLHANFKLSKSGEVVTLVKENLLIDRIEFGMQRPDESIGRIGNKSQQPQPLVPTPGAANKPLP